MSRGHDTSQKLHEAALGHPRLRTVVVAETGEVVVVIVVVVVVAVAVAVEVVVVVLELLVYFEYLDLYSSLLFE